MATRLFFPLVILIATFGIECQKDITIKTFIKDEDSRPKYIGADVIVGKSILDFPPTRFTSMRSIYACPKGNDSYGIQFKVDEVSGWTVKLNTAIDSGEYKSYEKSQEATIEGIIGDKSCFIYGTWWSSETKTIQFYLNILTQVENINKNDALYFKTVVEKEKISSRLMIDYTDGYYEEVQKYEIQTLRPRNFGHNLGEFIGKLFEKLFGSKETKQITAKLNENLALIEKCGLDMKTCIGDLQCKVKEGTETQFNLENSLIEVEGNGEFNMILLKKASIFNTSKEVAERFAEVGTTPTIETYFANVQCSVDRKIDFTLNDPIEISIKSNNPKILL